MYVFSRLVQCAVRMLKHKKGLCFGFIELIAGLLRRQGDSAALQGGASPRRPIDRVLARMR